MEFPNALQEVIKKNDLFDRDSHLLLAVSGGVDSMVLLHLLHQLGYKVSVVHCNYKLRGTASDLDEDLVKKTCGDMKLSCYSTVLSLSKDRVEKGGSIQQEARELRYLYFENLCRDIGADFIVTAHQLDDQIETFLYHLSRGASLNGLRGIPMKRDRLRRPMLNFDREAVLEYAKQFNVKYREDESNASLKYKRNVIRHQLIPVLTQLNTSFKQVMKRNFSLIEGQYQVWQRSFERWKKNKVMQGGYVQLSWEELSDEVEAHFLRSYLSEKGFVDKQVVDFLTAGQHMLVGKYIQGNDYCLYIDRGGVLLQGKGKRFSGTYELDDDSTGVRFSLKNIDASSFQPKRRSNAAAIDAAIIQGELKLRKWREGDRFQPFGMKGQKKLSDFFTDEKFSQRDKEEVWLLCDEKNIIWIVGWRIDDRYRVTSDTTKVLEVHWEK